MKPEDTLDRPGDQIPKIKERKLGGGVVSPHTAAFDRGETPYFHGRETILDDFEDTLLRAVQSNGGTTHLFYGAPGAGKSALLGHCRRIALGAQWETATITGTALYEPSELLTALGREKEPLGIETTHGLDAKIYQGTMTRTRPDRTIGSILADGEHPLLLLFDEAQMLGYGDDAPRGETLTTLKSTFELIHNGKVGRPIVMLIAGLRTARSTLKSLQITRFGEMNTTKLGLLSGAESRSVIRDWIVKYGMSKGDTAGWINAIDAEAGRWPRHVHSYAKHAGEYLRAYGGVMTLEGLSAVMEKGLVGRIQYYKQRIEDFYVDERKHVAKAISGYPSGTPFDRLDIIAHLSKIYGKKESKDIFDRLIDKGVVDEEGSEGYIVPIPSMHTWLVEEYAKGTLKGKDDDGKPKQLSPIPKQDLLPPEIPKQLSDRKGESSSSKTNNRGRSRWSNIP